MTPWSVPSKLRGKLALAAFAADVARVHVRWLEASQSFIAFIQQPEVIGKILTLLVTVALPGISPVTLRDRLREAAWQLGGTSG